MNKVTPWIIRGVIVAVYIALAIAEAGTYLADMYDVSMILFYIVIITTAAFPDWTLLENINTDMLE